MHTKTISLSSIIVLPIIIISIGISLYQPTTYLYNQTYLNQTIINPELNKDYIKSDLFIIKNIAKDIAKANIYNFGIYDCENYSQELKYALENQGYNSFCEAGYYDYNISMPHEWVRVELNNKVYRIESVYGKLISDDWFTEHYQLMSDNFCP